MASPDWGYDGENGKHSSAHVAQITACSLFQEKRY